MTASPKRNRKIQSRLGDNPNSDQEPRSVSEEATHQPGVSGWGARCTEEQQQAEHWEELTVSKTGRDSQWRERRAPGESAASSPEKRTWETVQPGWAPALRSIASRCREALPCERRCISSLHTRSQTLLGAH